MPELHFEQQVTFFYTTDLETTAKFSNQLQYFSKEFDRRLTQLEIPEGSRVSSENGIVRKPRSIVRLGLRLTISDGLWGHLGRSAGEVWRSGAGQGLLVRTAARGSPRIHRRATKRSR